MSEKKDAKLQVYVDALVREGLFQEDGGNYFVVTNQPIPGEIAYVFKVQADGVLGPNSTEVIGLEALTHAFPDKDGLIVTLGADVREPNLPYNFAVLSERMRTGKQTAFIAGATSEDLNARYGAGVGVFQPMEGFGALELVEGGNYTAVTSKLDFLNGVPRDPVGSGPNRYKWQKERDIVWPLDPTVDVEGFVDWEGLGCPDPATGVVIQKYRKTSGQLGQKVEYVEQLPANMTVRAPAGGKIVHAIAHDAGEVAAVCIDHSPQPDVFHLESDLEGLSPEGLLVKTGDQVVKGQPLGVIGDRNLAPNHLVFRLSSYANSITIRRPLEYVNPLEFVTRYQNSSA